MPFSPETLNEKPYNQCIRCEHIGVKCDGPNFLAMSADRFAEWCRVRKEYLGWTNAIIAEKSGLSLASVNRILSGSADGMNNTTMQAITRVLVNGSWGQYPCASSDLDLADREAAARAECGRLQQELDRLSGDNRAKIDHLKSQVEFLREQMRAKDHLLEERAAFLRTKDRMIWLFACFVVMLLAIIIGVIVFDLLNPSTGFFR